MRNLFSIRMVVPLMLLSASAAHASIIIDSFVFPTSTGQGVTLPTTSPGQYQNNSNSVVPSDPTTILGGHRDLYVERTAAAANGAVTIDSGQTLSGFATFSTGSFTTGYGTFTYDGSGGTYYTLSDPAPGAANTTNYTGLNHLDLTAGSTLSVFDGKFGADHTGGIFTIFAFTSATQYSRFDLALPLVDLSNPANLQFFQVGFNNPTSTVGGGANFHDIGAVVLLVNGLTQANLQVGFAFLQADTPEPSTWGMMGIGFALVAWKSRRMIKR